MNAEFLLSVSGMVLSLLFSYLPGLEGWYAELAADIKRLIMLAVVAAVSIVVYALSCAGLLSEFLPGAELACGREGIIALVKGFFAALIANQATYKVSPRGND